MWLPRATCPQCQQPEAVQQTCLACGYVYPPVALLTMLLRLMIAIPVGVIALLTMLLVITLLSKYVIFPAMAFIVRL
jgi:antibiotic biosynthesis monooxygenase (ABM) superfamily enzyme